ncbi:MAG: AAA family ATPase, partial [Clostridiales bacterium]|nr:AAA family ATPase [Clostridiales bacterium]
AETAAEAMGLPCDRYDMSDFATEFSYEELIGTSQIYQNSKEGRLVEFVTDHPQCLLIFDEIEKAHMNVIRLFLQLLGSGYLRSEHSEKTIDFRDTIVIFTSNVGKELYEDRSVNLTTLPERVLIDAVKREKDAQGNQTLPNEICSRLAAGNTILFNHLSIRHLTEMVTEGFDRVVEDMKAEYDCDVDYTEKLPLLFLFNRGSEIDARIASGHSGNFLKKEIYELIRQLESRDNDQDVSSIYFDVDWDSADSELKPLFENDGKSKILVFASETVTKEFGFENCKYEVFKADTIEKARELLKHDFTAVFIDPFYGPRGGDDRTLSASNLNTEGISFFHELTEAGGRLPIYLLDVDPPFSEVDRRTLIQEGAFGVILPDGLTADGADTFSEIMDELYMEKQNLSFSGRGYVVDFKTRQETDDDGNIRIVYYDLKKRMAVDLDSRKAMLDESERPSIKFDDVIGAENAKEELTYFIRFLQNPREFILGGNKAPNGVLLYGPPGTGKTMLAKAMAGESNVSFISCAASDFANKWVGEGEENIRRLFRRAKKYAPSIIFIDEIDAIGRQRTGLDPHNETLLNTLLTQMQGFEEVDPDRPVFVLAATNYGARGGGSDKGISALDEALVRRFDNRIYVDLPNEDERKQFLDIQIKKKKAEITDDCIKNVAERTPGISLAILQNIIDLAFREADRQSVTMNDSLLLKALEDYQHGERKEQSEEYYRHVAVHETGHAYVSYLSGDAPSYITIESRGDFGGYMQHSNNEDTPSYTRDELMGRIRTSLAGRAAETVFYGKEIANNTGASSDLKNTTDLAFMIISSYGMEEGQYVVLSKDEILGSPIAGDYIERVNSMIAREMENTIKLVTDGKEYIKKAADELIKKNHLTGAEFK